MFTEFLKAPLSRLVIFLCVVTLLACPGALVIWMMEPDQFHALNSFQLVVLSVALVMPFILLNSVVVACAFSLHRAFNRRIRHRNVRPPREAVVAAGVVFAGAIGAVVPAYAPILAHVFGFASTVPEMTVVALKFEILPLVVLLLVNPTNYWQGIDEEAAAKPAPKKLDMAVELHMHRGAVERSGTHPPIK